MKNLLHNDPEFFFSKILSDIQGFSIFMMDKKGFITSWNKGCELMKGYKTEEIINHNYEILFPDFLRERNKPQLELHEAFKKGRYSTEDWRRKKNGELFWANVVLTKIEDEEGAFVGYVEITQDHSERKKLETELRVQNEVIQSFNRRKRKNAEEKLYQSELSLKEAQRLSLLGNWCLNWEDKRLVWSDEVLRIFGFENNKTITLEDLINCVHPDDMESISKIFEKTLSEKTPYDVIHRIITKQGDLKYIHQRGETIFEDDGTPLKAVGTIQDVTVKKLAELDRDKTTSDLIQRNKELEQYTYIVSHNLRSPVATILGCADILIDPEFDEKCKSEVLKGLFISTQRLDNILKDLNNILQIKSDINEKKEIVDLTLLVEELKLVLESLIKREKVAIIYDFKSINEIFSLKTYLYSIFLNLLTNSIKYRQDNVSPIIKITSKKQDDKLELVFEDNGRGIDLIQKGDEVFGLYKRFHREIEGKGMGLFMVKTQVETLGGNISIQSEVNKGTTFTIVFDL